MIHEKVMNTVSLEFSSLARTKAMDGDRLYSLGLGEPFWEAPQIVRQKLSDLALSHHFGYRSPYGNLELRRMIADKLNIKDGNKIELDNVMIAAGSKQALSIALKVILQDDDEVIILDPCFVSYHPQVLLANHRAKTISCRLADDFKIDFNEINRHISKRTKAILVNTPNNPSGAVISREEMESLITIAKDSGAYIICDEIYRDFVFGDTKFVSANLYRDKYDKIITIDGFSKTYGMTGWRLGYLVASKEFISKAAIVMQHEMTNVPEILQVAACELSALPKEWFEKYRMILAGNAKYYLEMTAKTNVLSTIPIQAGMFCFTKFDINNVGSDKISVDLLKDQSVAVTPGIAFGKTWDSYIRISLSSEENKFREAVERLVKFFSKF